jgi:hypothetical protein
MKNFSTQICAGLTLAATSSVALAQSPSGTDVLVTVTPTTAPNQMLILA